MHKLLRRLLNKRGIKDIEELSPEEKTQIQQWQHVLAEGDTTVEKIRGFCEEQIRLIETKFKDTSRLPQQTERLVAAHSVYASIRELIGAPNHQREQLIKYLQDLV